MEVVLLAKARKDYDYWKQTGNVKIMQRITKLLKDIELHPFSGLGKPEPLRVIFRANGVVASLMSTVWFILSVAVVSTFMFFL